MTPDELREKSDEELRDLEDQLDDELFRLKMRHQTGQLQQTAELKSKRKDIARIKTILRERELSAES
jgi:large subunit ribosomal protein L29